MILTQPLSYILYISKIKGKSEVTIKEILHYCNHPIGPILK